MKKFLLFFLGLTAFNAQSQIEIRLDGETEDISGTTVTRNITLNDVPAGDEGTFWEGAKFHVYNMTGADQKFRLKRVRVSVPSDWSDNLCWPPLCYTNITNQESNGYYISPSSASYLPMITDGSASFTITDIIGEDTIVTSGDAEIKPQIYPGEPGSSATYRFIVTDSLGTTDYDSVTLVVNYVNNLSISTAPKTTELTMSPNPASDFVSIEAEGITDGKVRIVDVLGNVVYTAEFNNSKKLNLAEYKNGVYFITVQSSSNKGITKKLVIKH